MAAGESCFTAELTEDEVTKLLENATKFGTKYLMANAYKCTTNANEWALKETWNNLWEVPKIDRYKSAQI